ncbi:unnamed protein product [Cuscuta epithymum]|uniref:Cysteine proteinase inhibitor n=1 Tax=Cuscuta epithymum TaxID=186058 RepID=A0AAV0FIS1_9ASTE|nr:unnamed protein product [Cuscuta epithymum]
MALRIAINRSSVNSFKVNNSKVFSGYVAAAHATTYTLTNHRKEVSNFSTGTHSSIRKFSSTIDYGVEELPDYSRYCHQVETTMGFGIDVDLGNYSSIIRPYKGSLDDPKVTIPARFAVDTHNKSKGTHTQFLNVVKANYSGNMYYLSFNAIDPNAGGVEKRFIAQVLVGPKNEMELLLFGDADNPPQQSKKVAFKFKWDMFFPNRYYYWHDEGEFVPNFMTAEVLWYPRDCYKFQRKDDSSKGSSVDRVTFDEDTPATFHNGWDVDVSDKIKTMGHFAVEQYNKEEEDMELHFERVIKATLDTFFCFHYNLTLEATENGKKKLYQASVQKRKDSLHLHLFRPVDGITKVTEN